MSFDAEGHLSVGEAGFKSTTDYHRFLKVAEQEKDFPLNCLETFLNTTDQDILIYIGKSRFVAKKIKEAIERSIDPWQPETIQQILMILNHVPFELSNLIDNDLGHAVKNIKKTALLLNNKLIIDETTDLIKHWKEMQSKQVSGKRDSPERSSSDSPPATEQKKIRLAIQKDPPARPKAIADINFFNPSLGPDVKKFRIVRPIYSVGPNKEEEQPLVIAKPLSNKKSVTFADKLFEIREYEKNPEEWTSFDTAPQAEQPYYNIPTVTWYHPLELSFNTDENPNLVISKQVRTTETASQDSREKIALAAIYTSAQHIPSSPGEPDEVPNPNTDTRPIPLVDVNSQPAVHNNSPVVVASHQTINPNMMTPANLNAAAAIAAAMDPYLIPQQQYQPSPPPAPVQQPEISNHTVEAMLKNNPGIMQSLKQLSFLAAGNTAAIQPTPNYQANSYQQAVPIHQPQNYSNEDYSRENRNRQQQKSRGRGQSRGRGANRGGGGPIRSNIGNRTCNYYASAEGCRNGTNCPFSHDQ